MEKIVISRTKWHGFGKTPSLIKEHVNERIKNAYKESSFYKKTRWIKYLPGKMKIGLLRTLRYNGLLFEENGIIVSSIFFQQRENALHVFSIWVEAQSRKKGIANQRTRDFVEFALKEPKIMRCRIGASNNSAVDAIYNGLKKNRFQEQK